MMSKDWQMRRLCLPCSAALAAELDGAYKVRQDQLDVRAETCKCSRCGKVKQCKVYWLEVDHG